MTASRVFRSLLRAVPAVLLAVIAAATFAVAGGVASAAPFPGIPSVPNFSHRLEIGPGESQYTGSVIEGKSDGYAIAAGGGLKLHLEVTSPNNNARVSVAPLIGPMIATEAPTADFVTDGTDYQVRVTSADGNAADYTLTIKADPAV
ncbi:hypothetical protein NDR87_10285 [Nocardia sp. CDC159]|uniref:Cadherin-like beta sandwich domain-containing protein n=1 Tax=Nocardia pulmonis TaxID=2951408 RepID=A0A9X2E580_9NOCA|nr:MULTISPECIES: hypothetical protein [Nocardia]MCM6773856.1 hypothetical protein [Nocardia pulmonis]MCM6786743.1 hypothetical protein [Nocardia sp. CDC159]